MVTRLTWLVALALGLSPGLAAGDDVKPRRPPGKARGTAEAIAVEVTPLTPLSGSPCLGTSSQCGGRQRPVCRVARRARSRGRSVQVELVEDGNMLEVVQVHLVVRTAGAAWVLRNVGSHGVACGTRGLLRQGFRVLDLTVADRLFGPRPEVALRTSHEHGDGQGDAMQMLICTMDAERTPPACARLWIHGDTRVRYVRPDVVVVSGLREGVWRYRIARQIK